MAEAPKQGEIMSPSERWIDRIRPQLRKNIRRAIKVLVPAFIVDLIKDRYIGGTNRLIDTHASGVFHTVLSWCVNRPFVTTGIAAVAFVSVLVWHAIVTSRRGGAN